MENLIIIGTGTNARHAFQFIKMYNLYNIIGFAVNEKYYKDSEFLGYPVYKLEKLDNIKVPFKVFIALLWNRLNKERRELFEYCDHNNMEFANLISPTAIIRPSAEIGRNCWVHDYTVIQNNTIIGDNVPIMAFTLVGADCNIGSHCFLGAKSLIGGESCIGEQSFIGLNATIFDNVKVGNKCIVGACSILKRALPSFTRYVPANGLYDIKQYSEDEIEDKLVFFKNVR